MFAVSFSPEAEADLLRLLDFLLDRAETVDDLDEAEGTIAVVRTAVTEHLARTPYSYRKAGDGRRSTRRELIVPSGRTGYVALFEIAGPASVVVLAVRHQREDDYD